MLGSEMKQERIRRIASLKAIIQPLLTEHQALADGAKNEEGEDRAFNHEEFEKHTQLAGEISNLTHELESLETELRAINSVQRDHEEKAERGGYHSIEQLPQNTAEYRETFAQALTTGNKGPNLEKVQRLAELIGPNHQNLTGESPSTGAVLIPTIIVEQIMMEAAKASALLRVSDVSMTSNLIQTMPFLSELGLMSPRSQAESYVKSAPTIAGKDRSIYNFGLLFSVAQELRDDVPALEAALSAQVGRSAGYSVEEYGFKGVNGEADFTDQAGNAVTLTLTNKVPTGILEYAAGVVPAVTAAATAAVAYDDIVKLKQAVNPVADAGGSFIVSRDFETQVYLLKDSQGRPLWQPAVAAGRPNTILGAPYDLTTRLADVAVSSTPAVFGDFRSAHKIDMKKDWVMKSSEHFYFGSGNIAYAADMRFGALVYLNEYIARLNMAAA